MDLKQVKFKLKTTPAFVLDENRVGQNLAELETIKQHSGCQVLYSIKALPLEVLLKRMVNRVDGFSVSSLFEARLANEILAGSSGSIHITTPGLRNEEFNEISQLCSHISFNSLSQYQRSKILAPTTSYSAGLRINPKLSFAADPRFDPCRQYSKLGVDLNELDSIHQDISGLHFHTVFSNTNYQALDKTLLLLKNKWGDQLSELSWINLGGGCLFNQIQNHQILIDWIQRLKTDYQLEVFIEPGKAIVGDAGFIVTSVIDRFSSDGKSVLVLDTSVNHNPEVFEYQKQPDLLEQDKRGDIKCLLVGSSCLAGDIFGEYLFVNEPKIGDRLVFSNVGAYSLIKANRFNGYNFPDIYAVDKQGEVTLIKQSSYQNYREQWGIV